MLKNFIFKESLGKEYPEQELNRSIATFANFFGKILLRCT